MAREDLNLEVVEKITKNNRGCRRKHMLQHFPDLKESQQDRKREDMKVTIQNYRKETENSWRKRKVNSQKKCMTAMGCRKLLV